jgi:glycosyltransferase involved in cell wall biosynthesis
VTLPSRKSFPTGFPKTFSLAVKSSRSSTNWNAALAGALGTLARDSARRQRFGEAARALSAEYTWDRRAERLEEAFAAALST